MEGNGSLPHQIPAFMIFRSCYHVNKTVNTCEYLRAKKVILA